MRQFAPDSPLTPDTDPAPAVAGRLNPGGPILDYSPPPWIGRVHITKLPDEITLDLPVRSRWRLAWIAVGHGGLAMFSATLGILSWMAAEQRFAGAAVLLLIGLIMAGVTVYDLLDHRTRWQTVRIRPRGLIISDYRHFKSAEESIEWWQIDGLTLVWPQHRLSDDDTIEPGLRLNFTDGPDRRSFTLMTSGTHRELQAVFDLLNACSGNQLQTR